MAVMRFAVAIFFALALLFAAPPARADIDQIEAREVARNNNCTPTKIEVYEQSLGAEGRTIYRVDCTLPKMADPNAPKTDNALLIACKDSLCELLRPLEGESK
jgi:hypothetical protein